MWRSGKERVTARSPESRRSSASHRVFWKVPPGAPQPSSFVSEPRRVTHRKSRPSRRCHRPRLPRQQRGGARAELGFAERPSGGGSKLGFVALLELSGAHTSTEYEARAGIAQGRCNSERTRNFQISGAADEACEGAVARDRGLVLCAERVFRRTKLCSTSTLLAFRLPLSASLTSLVL